MSVKCFRDLEIWKLGKEIVVDIYHLTNQLPDREKYGLSSQMCRASVSIPSNIAEGFNRYQNNEYRRFLYIALGSCAELETQLEICFEVNLIDEIIKQKLIQKINIESRMITSLIKKL